MNIKLSICLICLLILAIPAHIFAENSQTKAALTEDDGYEEDDLLENNPQLDEILAEPVDLMPAAPLRMTLEDCIKIALEHNAKLQATGYAVDAARAQFREASAVGWPIVDYEYRSAPIPHDVSNAMDSFFSGDMAWWNKLKVGVF
ncbi:MAG: hypothetical protein HYT75_01395 [Deltaproteobacteria bacterium]|nr:hypothetical protein [Deltaproteobacteria bacterium]